MKALLGRLQLVSLFALLVLLACSSEAPPPAAGVGRAVISAAMLSSASAVAGVTVTVSGPGITSPIVTSLSQSGSTWLGTIGGIPAGSGRTFDVAAFDASNNLLYQGTATNVTINPGQTAQVNVQLTEVNPPAPFSNAAPVIDAIALSTTSVLPGGTVSVSVTAHDPNGDPLTYSWSATGGSFDDSSSTSPVWTAPGTGGTQTLSLVVTDSHQASASVMLQIQVQATGSADVSITFNNSPVIQAMTSVHNPVTPGVPTSLGVQAQDSDGDPLTFSWTSDCPGSYDDATAQSPVFTLASLPSNGQCTFNVDVSDGRGGETTGSFVVAAGYPVSPSSAPVIDTTSQSSTTVQVGATVTLQVMGHIDDAGPVSVSWGVNPGDSNLTTQVDLSTNGNNFTATATVQAASCAGFGPQTVVIAIYDYATNLVSYSSFPLSSCSATPAGPSPEVVATSVHPTQITVANNQLYFNDPGVTVTDLAGGNRTQIFNGTANWFAVDTGNTVYVNDLTSIWIVNGGGQNTLFVPAFNALIGLAYTGAGLYFTDGSVVLFDGQEEHLGDMNASWSALAVVGNTVFSIANGTVYITSAFGGTTSSDFSTGESNLAWDASYAYFTTTDGNIIRADQSGQPQIIAQNQASPTVIAVSGSDVYWFNSADQTLMHLSTAAGGNPNVVYSPGTNVTALAAGPGYLYYQDSVNQQLMRIAR
jgi:hypothetical protein